MDRQKQAHIAELAFISSVKRISRRNNDSCIIISSVHVTFSILTIFQLFLESTKAQNLEIKLIEYCYIFIYLIIMIDKKIFIFLVKIGHYISLKLSS